MNWLVSLELNERKIVRKGKYIKLYKALTEHRENNALFNERERHPEPGLLSILAQDG